MSLAAPPRDGRRTPRPATLGHAATRRLPRLRSHEASWLIVSALVVALALAPLCGLVVFALRGSGEEWPNLIRNVLPEALRTTVLLLVGVGAIVSALGVGAAWIVTMHRFPGRRLLEWALLLPLAVPTYIIAYAYLDILHPIGPVQSALRAILGVERPRDLRLPEIRSLGGAILLMGFVLYPYVYLPVRALFAMQSATMLEVARTLGASRAKVFWRVAMPLARPAIAVGVSLALMECLNDVGASEFLGVRTLTVAIYTTWTTRMSVEGAAQIALVMLAVVFALVLLERWARRKQRYVAQTRRDSAPSPVDLRGGPALAATCACLVPIIIGFGIPAAYLVVQSWRRVRLAGLPRDLPIWIGNTVLFAALATITAVLLGLVLAYASRLSRHNAAPILVRLASIGYAIPGTVLAVGLLVPLATLDNAVDGFSRARFGVSTGLLLTGSGGALILAYVLRFLAIPAGGIEAGLAKISPHLDMAARSLGSRPLKVLGVIHLPLLWPAVAAAAMLVFVDCLKELPATLLLQPFNFTTLSTALYGEAKRGTYENGAVAALAIVLAGIVPVVVLAWMNSSGRPGGQKANTGRSA